MSRIIPALFTATLFLVAPVPLRADEQEEHCRQNLQQLSGAIQTYRLAHEGKSPPQLSDLYYESYADDVTLYRCPSVQGPRLLRTEIDDKSEYTAQQLAGQPPLLVRERAAHHGGGNTVLAVLEDGTIKPLPLDSAKNGGEVVAAKKPNDPASKDANPQKPTARTGVKPPLHNDGSIQIRSVDPGLISGEGLKIDTAGGGGLPGSLPPGAVISQGRMPPAGAGPDATNQEDNAARMRQGVATFRGAFSAEQSLGLADTICSDGGYDAAIVLYERVLDADANNQRALLGISRASIQIGALRTARARLAALLKQKPDDPEARRLNATVDLLLGDTKNAITAADALMSAMPGDPDVALLHAQTALYAGNDAEAAKRFAAIATAQPTAAAQQQKLANSYLDQRFWRLALLHCRTAMALDPNDELSQLNAGVAATKLGEKELAIRLYTSFLRRHPDDSESTYINAELEKLKQK